MFYTPNKKTSILQIDNDFFATLKNVHSDGTVEFEFNYSISQKEVIKNSAYHVNVTIHEEKNSTTKTNNVSVDPKSFVDSILRDVTDVKNFINKEIKSEIFSTKSDITSFIDNQHIEKFQKAIATGDDSELPVINVLKAVPAKTLKNSNNNQVIYDQLVIDKKNINKNSSAALSENTRKLSNDLLLNKRTDPATFVPNTKFKNSFQTTQGISLASKKTEVAEEVNRLNDYTFHSQNQSKINSEVSELDDNDTVVMVSTEKNDIIKIPVNVKFLNNSSNYIVQFDLINNKTSEIIDTVKKSLSVYKHINNFSIPVIPPKIAITKSSINSATFLEVRQLDPIAKKVIIYKKNINTTIPDKNSYIQIDQVDLLPGRSTKIDVTKFVNCENQIYRAVPATQNYISNVFSGAVINSIVPKKINSVVITSQNTSSGIEVKATNIPIDVVSIRFMRKNLSLFETRYIPVGNLKGKEINVVLDSFSFVDKFVNEFHVYEYAVQIEYLGGSRSICGNEIIEYVQERPGKVNISTNNLSVDSQNKNVSFEVEMFIKDENINQIRDVLQQQGFDSYFEKELSESKDEINKLLAYSVERINLNNGERENLGVYTDMSFDAINAQKKSNAKPMEAGKNYKFIVKTLLRTPDASLENYKKNVINPITKKKYSYYPYTSKHPVSLRKGTIITANSLKSQYSKNFFEHGEIGCTAVFDVSFTENKSYIKNVYAERISEKEVIISCEIAGNARYFDHFIVSMKLGSIATKIGTLQPIIVNGYCKYKHILGGDIGNIKYLITPVYNNYVHGNAVESNSILVES